MVEKYTPYKVRNVHSTIQDRQKLDLSILIDINKDLIIILQQLVLSRL